MAVAHALLSLASVPGLGSALVLLQASSLHRVLQPGHYHLLSWITLPSGVWWGSPGLTGSLAALEPLPSRGSSICLPRGDDQRCLVVSNSATPWTVGPPPSRRKQAPPSTEFSRQEYGSGLPFPPPGDLGDPGVTPAALASPALAGRFFTSRATWEAKDVSRRCQTSLSWESRFIP